MAKATKETKPEQLNSSDQSGAAQVTEQKTLEVGTVTVERISKKGDPVSAHPNDVKFQVKYPDGWKGEKTMPEGVIVVSKESAKHFASLGIGSIK